MRSFGEVVVDDAKDLKGVKCGVVRCSPVAFAGEGEVGFVFVVLDVEQLSVNGGRGWR